MFFVNSSYFMIKYLSENNQAPKRELNMEIVMKI